MGSLKPIDPKEFEELKHLFEKTTLNFVFLLHEMHRMGIIDEADYLLTGGEWFSIRLKLWEQIQKVEQLNRDRP